jgi:formylmethanofuran dehydrogenase subunit A
MRGLLIKNGRVVNPLNGERFVRRDIHVQNGKISDTPVHAPQVIDADNCVVMAGGIDVHTHVTDQALGNAHDDGAVRTRMASTGLRYAQMGYTTIIQAVSPLRLASITAERMAMIPQVDKGSLVMMGAWEPVLRLVERRDEKALASLASWLTAKAGAYSIKLVNPGGRFLKNTGSPSANRRLEGFDVTPLDVACVVARAVETGGLPCPVQLHLNDLGETWSHTSAIETINGLDGARAHLAHLQFHCYGDRYGFSSEARAVADAFNANTNLTADIGQVAFGKTVTVTADERLGEKLDSLTSGAGQRDNVGFGETCFCVPYEYRADSATNAVQWACGLELALSIEDPSRIFISTDHPNGGPFTAYPQIIRLLMDKKFRDAELSRIHPAARQRTSLGDIQRELNLYDIAQMTRSGPAKFLGIADRKGNLKPGSDADITIYRNGGDIEEMFAKPAWVIKSGEVIVKDGKTIAEVTGEILLYRADAGEQEPSAEILGWIGDHGGDGSL